MTTLFSKYSPLLMLQDYDLDISRIDLKLRKLESRLAYDAAEASLKKTQSTATELIEKDEVVSKEKKALQIKIDAANNSMASSNARLYSGEATSVKELQAVQTEIEHAETELDELETSMLLSMTTSENISSGIEMASKKIEELENELEALNVVLKKDEVSLLEEKQVATKARDKFFKTLEPDALKIYENATPGLPVVARLDENKCTGCHLTLAFGEVERIKRSPDELHYCEQCGIILLVA